MCKDPVVREGNVFLKTWKKGGVDVAERAKRSTTVYQARDRSSQVALGLVDHVKDLNFYPKSSGRPLNGLKMGDNMNRFTFSKSSC